ncbi:MAG: NADH-quinone oxidoreductase subunit M [Ignavibacteriales bacterium]|nr:NADH-quinone oxidoreductase subunit M [Ignavibacteriales bacterium]
MLSFVLFSPFLGILLLALVPKGKASIVKIVGIASSLLTFLLSLAVYWHFNPLSAELQFVEQLPWIHSLDMNYIVGVDGMSLLLLVLTTFLTPIALVASWNSITDRLKGYVVCMLLLEVGMIGVFVAVDLFLFYVFWEAMLIPMYFIIGIWGGKDRIYAAVKFFLYTMAGSLLMLIAIISLAYYASTVPQGQFTTDLRKLMAIAPGIASPMQAWMFLAFALSFAIKVPLFPFHTWLPDAHVQAPTAGSVILAGVLLKMGTYGMLRFCLPLFPFASFQFAPYICVLAVIGIVYGALVAMVQTDIKKLVAYSSVSHLGFVVLGIFSMTEEGIQGGILQMINHGLSTGALFLIVGMIYDRRHTREISEFGGLSKQMPVFASFFMITMLSSIGLPGLNGFVGEFLILLGSFKSSFLGTHVFTIVAASGVVFAAVYMLWMFQRVMFGTLKNPANQNLPDLSVREIGLLIPIMIFIVWIGIYPTTFLRPPAASTAKLVKMLEQTRNGETLMKGSREK